MFVFLISATGSLFPYMPVYMRQFGLSPWESATVIGTAWFIAALIQPAYGLIADQLQRHTHIMMLCLISSSILFGCLLLFPPLNYDDQNMVSDKMVFFSGPQYNHMVICCDHNCQKSDEISDTGRNGANISIITGEVVGFVPSIRVYEKATWDVPLCVDVTSNLTLFNMSDKLGIPMSAHFKTKQSTCQLEIISRKKRASDTTMSDIHCSDNYTFLCYTEGPLVKEQSTDPTMDASGKFSVTFWLFGLVYIISHVSMVPIHNLVDALTYSHLGDERGSWGFQRVWGTIGFALFGVIAGFVMDIVKGGTEDINYSWCFGLFIVNNLLATCSVCCYKTYDAVQCSKPVQKLHQLLRNAEVLLLFSLVLVLGIFMGIIETFRFWHLQNLGASQLLLGLCLVMACLPEMCLMFCMEYILKFAGEQLCLCSACFAYACRFLGYSFLINPWFVLLVEPLNGITSAVMYGAASAYGSRLTPEGLHGTMQAMLMSLHFGFGEFQHVT